MTAAILLVAAFTVNGSPAQSEVDRFITVEQCEQRVTQLERLTTDLQLMCIEK